MNVSLLSVIMLNVVMLSVVMLNVVASAYEKRRRNSNKKPEVESD